MSARYEISEGELDVLAITGPEGTRYIDGEEIEARVIRQQCADIAALQQVISDQILVIEDLDYRRGKVCDENDQLRAELAAAVAERDRLTRRVAELNAECSFIAKDCAHAESENETLRARLAAIDNAPTAARVWFARDNDGRTCAGLDYAELPPIGTELIARPAKEAM